MTRPQPLVAPSVPTTLDVVTSGAVVDDVVLIADFVAFSVDDESDTIRSFPHAATASAATADTATARSIGLTWSTLLTLDSTEKSHVTSTPRAHSADPEQSVQRAEWPFGLASGDP